jgi:hypothetical protein
MRIRSTFHDYYDSVQAHGQDDTLLYLRYPKTIELKGTAGPPCYEYGTSPWDRSCYSIRGRVVGFCGKIYPVMLVEVRIGIGVAPTKTVCHTINDVDAAIKPHLNKRELSDYSRIPRCRACVSQEGIRFRIAQFFKKFAEQADKYEVWFLDNHAPLFVARPGFYDRRLRKFRPTTVEFNARLKPYEFYRVFDPFRTFQEISMFLGGLAVPQKPIPVPSDKIMAEIKGFDKWSFRKEPTRRA